MSVLLRSVKDHCLARTRVDAPVLGGRYRLLFEDLPPLSFDEDALHALGRPGGPCDLGAGLARDNDAKVAAVWPLFGQFIAHDITADRSPLVHRSDPARIRNFRVPKANLEGVYGTGPVGSPYLYRKDDPAKLLLSPSGCDVPRNHEGIALIGDPRNDVHLFVSQIVVAFIILHNRLIDRLRDEGTGEQEVFEEARRAATWHYQHVILREFLPVVIGARRPPISSTTARSCIAPTGIATSPSSSPMPPTGTVTHRFAIATRSMRTSARARCSPI